MLESRVAKKYATALFQLARTARLEREVWDDLVALREALRTDPRLLKTLAAPQISDEDKHRLVRAVLEGAAQKIVVDLLLFLTDKARTEHLPQIIDVYGRLLDAATGVVEATITSAAALSGEQVRRIVARLEKMSGKTVRYTLTTDPHILGGVVIIMGGEIMDHSVRHDLLRLRDMLRAVKVHEAA